VQPVTTDFIVEKRKVCNGRVTVTMYSMNVKREDIKCK
jgi:hypothetical protein